MTDRLAAITDAVASGGPHHAVRAAAAAVDAGAKLPDVVRAALAGHGDAVDLGAGFVPHGLLAMGAATRLSAQISTRLAPLPALQAIALLAKDPKRTGPRDRMTVVTGEITHLARSFEVAVRSGNPSDALAVFSGFLADGDEKKMAGDGLFRVAGEDDSDGGHKLLFATKAWQLAGFVGWKQAGPALRPAVAYVVSGTPDRTMHEAILRAWGKARVDIEAVSRNALPLGDHASDVATALAAATPEECARGLAEVLKAGVAIDALAERLVVEAARRLLAAKHLDFPAVHDILYADAARFVAAFSRTESRVYPVVHAGLRIRGKSADRGAPGAVAISDGGEALRALSGDLDHGHADAAVARVEAYIAHGLDGGKLVELLVHHACRETTTVDQGHGLALADAAAEGFGRSRDPRKSYLLAALAKSVAMAPRDRTTWAWLSAKYGL